MWKEVLEHDTSLFLLLNGRHAQYWDHLTTLFTSKAPWGVMYATILYVLCKHSRWKTALATVLAFVLLIVVSDQLTSSLLRPLFARPRPSREPALEGLVHLVDGRRGGAFGFPSAHAANTAALATFVILYFKQRALSAFFVAWMLVTCYTRVYLGVHYPGDLLAGMLVGALAGVGVYRAYRVFFPAIAPGEGSRALLVALIGLLTTLVIALYSLYCLFAR